MVFSPRKANLTWQITNTFLSTANGYD
jgi:hypothetical protein